MATPFMNLTLPIPHVTSGTWGEELNAAFALIDAHDHSPGSGHSLDLSAFLSSASPADVSSAVASAGVGLLASRDDHSHHIAFAGAAQAGIVATSAQTFAGVKTFSSGAIFSSITAPGITAAALAALSFISNLLSADTGTDFTFNTTNTRTAGLIVDIDNNSAHLLHLDYLGNLVTVGTVEGANLDATFTGSAGGSSSGSNTGDVTLAIVGAVPADEGASLTGQILTLQPADATHPGVMSAADKTKLDGLPSSIPAGALTYDLLFGSAGIPTASQVLGRAVMAKTVTLPINCLGSVGAVGVNPTAAATLTINKNGASVVTVDITVGGVVSFTNAAPVVFVLGDVITLVAQVAPDATLADIAITLIGTL